MPMLFDTGTADFPRSPDVCPELAVRPLFEPQTVAPDFWGEHCVECGAPACYGTCDKFRRGVDGRCRRFAHGILPVRDAAGRPGFAVQFRAWGKLELFFRGRMVLPATQARIGAKEARWMRFARVLNRVFCWFPYTRNPIAIWRSLRWRWVRRQDGLVQSPTHWVVQCVVSADVDLMMSVVDRDGQEVFIQRLALKKGPNAFVQEIPPVSAGAKFRVFSIAGTDVPVVFTQLELATGSAVATEKASNSSSPAQFVKCLAWDLDNTLWKGILAEDGQDGVVLRPEAVELVKTLDSRGILNTVCSKNDWAPVKSALEKFGLLEYFVFPEVNWDPKSGNLRRAAKNINIGLDTFAFIDDSSYERGEVVDHCPCVRVYAETELDRIAREACFNPPVSGEGRKRRLSYLNEMRRFEAERVSTGSREQFLRNCDIRLTCGPLATSALVRRCWELVNRTNQLTLAAHRYTEAEFAVLVQNPEVQSLAIHCKDKYGDYGIVGFIAVAVQDGAAYIREFVMSCRVAKKFCEQSVLLAVAESLKDRGGTSLAADVVATGRNGALIEAFDAMPFERHEEGTRRTYRLDLADKAWGAGCYRNPTTFGEVTC